jgi:hemerythrin
MTKKKIAAGMFWLEIPEADLRILCGCPADAVKHLIKAGLIAPIERGGVCFESGPNAILLSDASIQNGEMANLAEFPILQMLYRQGMILPNHPGNTGRRPMIIGIGDQVRSQVEYVFRGNYGLTSLEELESAGASPEEARTIFAVKKWFAFGSIKPTEALVDLRPVDADAVTIAQGIVVHRLGFNRYEFIGFGGRAEVDLTLGPGEVYSPPYALPTSGVARERFTVTHLGEGDGWDAHRPCMGSLVCCNGLLYLVDAGPYITRSLAALGFGVGDIEGIFQTHAHDDHFAGLASLARSERRLAYYAVPWVRASAAKKLSALLQVAEVGLDQLFAVRDLAPGRWNAIGDLAVRPVFSPHPVENSVFFFRAVSGAVQRVYAHLGDISSHDVLSRMAEPRSGTPVLSAASRQGIEEEMATAVDVKKVDAGGGLIHGDAKDFVGDTSERLLLSHGVEAVPEGFPASTAVAGFGQTDVLLSGGAAEWLKSMARIYIEELLPGTASAELDSLAAGPIIDLSPGDALRADDALIVVSGAVDELDKAGNTTRHHSGALLPPDADAVRRAAGALSVLALPAARLHELANRPDAVAARNLLQERYDLLTCCSLFAPVTSGRILLHVAAAMTERKFPAGAAAYDAAAPALYLLAEGEVDLSLGAQLVECVLPGGYWGEAGILGGSGALCLARAATDCRCFTVPAAALAGIPAVQWGLHESLDRRLHSFRAGFRFEWSDSFRVDVPELDEQHRRLFELANTLSLAIQETGTIAGHDAEKKELLEFTQKHFSTEEGILRERAYPRLDVQVREHAALVEHLAHFIAAGERRRRPRASSAVDYLKDWLIRHTLLEDQVYRLFLKGSTLPSA